MKTIIFSLTLLLTQLSFSQSKEDIEKYFIAGCGLSSPPEQQISDKEIEQFSLNILTKKEDFTLENKAISIQYLVKSDSNYIKDLIPLLKDKTLRGYVMTNIAYSGKFYEEVLAVIHKDLIDYSINDYIYKSNIISLLRIWMPSSSKTHLSSFISYWKSMDYVEKYPDLYLRAKKTLKNIIAYEAGGKTKLLMYKNRLNGDDDPKYIMNAIALKNDVDAIPLLRKKTPQYMEGEEYLIGNEDILYNSIKSINLRKQLGDTLFTKEEKKWIEFIEKNN